MSNETDLDQLSILRHGYERFLSETGDFDSCDNAIITVRHQKHITTHFGPLTAKNNIKVSLSQEQILNQTNRFHPSNITRSQSTNFQKSSFIPPFGGSMLNRGFHLYNRPAIRPSLIPIKIRNQTANFQRALTLGTTADEPKQRDFKPSYRPARKLSIPFEHRNYGSQDEESQLLSLPVTMTQSFQPVPMNSPQKYSVEADPDTDLLSRYKCGICLNILSDCRVLDCLHTFCLECLYSIEQTGPNRSLKRSTSLKSTATQPKSFENAISKIDNTNHCPSEDNEQKMSKSSRAFNNNPINRDTIASALKKCKTEQQKKITITLQSKRVLGAITEKYKVTLQCPICGQRTIIPIGGVCRVPKNFLVDRQMKDAVENLQTQQIPNQCCSQCHQQNEVNSFCVNCEIILCTVCTDAHLQQRWTSKHNLITLQSKNKPLTIKLDHHASNASGTLKCFIHPSQEIKLYCSNCEQVACHNCTILLHKGHTFESIDNAKNHVIDSLRNSIEGSKTFHEYIQNSILKSTETIAKLNEDADAVQNEMEMFIEDYFKALEAHKETLLFQISKAKEMRSLAFKEQQEYLIKRSNELKSVQMFAQNLLDHGNDIEILTFIGLLKKRFDSCQKPHNMLRIDPQNVNSLRFLRDVPAPTTTHHKNIPIYGIVSTQPAYAE